MKYLIACLLFVLSFSSVLAEEETKAHFWQNEEGVVEMKLEVNGFGNNQKIPSEYTCDGKDASPEIKWSGAPEGTKSFALSVIDPDAPMGDFVHWLIYDIPKDCAVIPKGGPLPPGAKETGNDFGKSSYGGPCPPSGTHRYFFTLYALDKEHLEEVKSKNFREKVKESTIASAEVIGLYSRGR